MSVGTREIGPALPPRVGVAPRRAPYVRDGFNQNLIWLKLGRTLLFAGAFLAGYHLLRLGDLNISFSDVCMVGAIVILATQGRVTAVPFGTLTPLWMIALGLMLGGLFVSTVAYGDLTRWIEVAGQYLFGFLLIPAVVMGQEQSFVRRLVAAFALGVVVMEASGILAVFTLEWDQASAMFGTGFLAGNGRLGSFAGEANWNGAMIAFALPMLIYAVHSKILPLAVGAVGVGLLVWGLLLSASFTGFAAAIVSSTLVIAFLGRKQVFKGLLLIGIVGGLAAVGGVPVPDVFGKRVGAALTTGSLESAGTYPGRADLIHEAWQMAENNLAIGIGADRYREVSADGQPVHNLYLLIWTEGGGIALVGLLGMLALLVIFAASGRRHHSPETAMALAVLAVFLIYTVSSPHMFSRQWVIPLMLALGTLYARPSPSLPKRAALPLFARH